MTCQQKSLNLLRFEESREKIKEIPLKKLAVHRYVIFNASVNVKVNVSVSVSVNVNVNNVNIFSLRVDVKGMKVRIP